MCASIDALQCMTGGHDLFRTGSIGRIRGFSVSNMLVKLFIFASHNIDKL